MLVEVLAVVLRFCVARGLSRAQLNSLCATSVVSGARVITFREMGLLFPGKITNPIIKPHSTKLIRNEPLIHSPNHHVG